MFLVYSLLYYSRRAKILKRGYPQVLYTLSPFLPVSLAQVTITHLFIFPLS